MPPTRQPVPAKGVLAQLDISVQEVARRYGCSSAYAGRALNGLVQASAGFRRFVAEMTGVEEAVLFAEPGPDSVAVLVRRSCTKQGLPERVADPAALAAVAAATGGAAR